MSVPTGKAGDSDRTPQAPATWPIFICYRQVDGRAAADWLYHALDKQPLPFIPEGYSAPPILELYFDQSAPAVGDWTRVHEPALQRARAMLLVCSPGAYVKLDDDWVHKELDWWMAHRETAPILLDTTGEGARWTPDAVRTRWPNAQRLLVRPETWAALPPQERGRIEANLRDRILSGIKESERATTYQDLEREKERTRELERLAAALGRDRRRLSLYLSVALSALLLVIAAAWYAVAQQRRAETSERQARASLALASAANARDPLVGAALVISADELSDGGATLANPSTATVIAQRIATTSRPIAALRHESRVTVATFSPDGRRVVSGSMDGTARVWNVDGSGSPVVFRGHGAAVSDVAFSSDGKRVVSASWDRTARIWNAVDGAEVMVLSGHELPVNSAEFSPDGSHVVTGSMDKTVRVWSAGERGNPVILKGHEGPVRTAAFDRSGSHLVTASDDGTARVWKADGTGTPVELSATSFDVRPGGETVFSTVAQGLTGATFSPDGASVVATAYSSNRVLVWRADGRGEPLRLTSSTPKGWLIGASFSPDGRRVGAVSTEGTTEVWTLDGAVRSVVFGRAMNPNLSLTQGSSSLSRAIHGSVRARRLFAPDGESVLGFSWDGTASIWRTNDPRPSQGMIHGAPVFTAEFSPDGRRIVTASDDGLVRVWDANWRGEPRSLEGHDANIVTVAFRPDGQQIATADDRGMTRVWSADGTGRPAVIHVSDSPIIAVAFGPQSDEIVTASRDGRLRVWKADGSGMVREMGSLKDGVRAAFISADGRYAVTFPEPSKAQLWDLTNSTSTDPFAFGKVSGPPAFASTGDEILFAAENGEVTAWSATGDTQPVRRSSSVPGTRLAMLGPHGDTLLLFMNDGSVRWRRRDGTQESVLGGLPADAVFDRWWSADMEEQISLFGPTAFAPDAGRVALVSRDEVLRVWDARDARSPVAIPVTGRVERLSFSPDGLRLLTVESYATARILDAAGRAEPLVLSDGDVVGNAGFSPDGRLVVTTSDRIALVWRVGWDMLLDHLRETTFYCLTAAQRMQYLAERPAEASAGAAACESSRSSGQVASTFSVSSLAWLSFSAYQALEDALSNTLVVRRSP